MPRVFVFSILLVVASFPAAADDLSDPAQTGRSDARQRWLARGPAGLALLAARAAHPEARVRREVAMALASSGDKRWLDPLMTLALDADPGVRSAAASGLARLGRAALSAVRLRKDASSEPLMLGRLRKLEALLLPALVERTLRASISPSGGWGHWKGQFADLVEYRIEVLPILRGMVRSRTNASIHRGTRLDRWITLRMLAIKALGDLGQGDAKTINLLTSAVTKPDDFIDGNRFRKEAIASPARVALYRLGKRSYLQGRVSMLKATVRHLKRRTGYQVQLIYYMGLLAGAHHSMGKYDEAIAVYRESLAMDPDSSGHHYNIACCYSIRGKGALAVSHLVKAINAGYDDLDYILLDGDLAKARKHPSFEARIRGHEKFAKRAPDGKNPEPKEGKLGDPGRRKGGRR